jgi:lipid-A-disaccharide synthase-like uncharacterized protein
MFLAAISWSWLIHQVQQPLVIFGFTAQFVFFLRFVVQWVVSEKRGQSHVPVSFWYLSLAGGLMTFVYAWRKEDVVFMTSQALAVFIYVRNLMLIYRPRARTRHAFPVVPMAEPVQDPPAFRSAKS